MVNSKKDKKLFYYSLSIIILLADTFLLFYLKYKNQKFPLSEFSINYFGNVLNLFFIAILILGLSINYLKKTNNFNPSFYLRFVIAITIALAACAIIIITSYTNSRGYFFGYPFSTVLKGFVFSLYQFLQFVLIIIIWLNIFEIKNLVVIKALLYSVIISAALLLFTFFYLNQNIENFNAYRTNNKLVVGVVLGAAVWSNNKPSPSLSGRVDKAIELFQNKIIDKIQLTGSNAPGELSEAKAALIYLKNKLLSSDDIWLEENTTSTTEQISFINYLLFHHSNIGSIVIISDNYHLARVKEICSFYKIKASFAGSDLKLNIRNQIYYKFRESIALTIFWLFAL